MTTTGVVFQGGFPGFAFVAYYPALALFVVVFTSLWLGLAWTTMTAITYSLVCVTVGPGLDIVAGHEKELLVRIAAMYAVVLCVSLIARFERGKRRAAVGRERELMRERIELSQSVHDTMAQSAYMIGLGIDAAKQAARESRDDLEDRLEATSLLSKTAIWQLRHPIDLGRIFEGRDLGRTLGSHVATFTTVTSVRAELQQTGAEPPLSIETRSMLFSIAHNALTNAFRHAGASRVYVRLDFGEERIRISVSDDGVGLPDDYEERGHGFANMARLAKRLGGRLVVEPGGPYGGASVACEAPTANLLQRRDRMPPETPRIRVLLADDHSIMRQGLNSMLEQSEEFEVVGQARDGAEAVQAASELVPDVVVMDVMMPNMNGVEACREIMESQPDTRVVMLTASTEEDAVIEAVAAGATGYLQKVSGKDQLLNALRLVAGGNLRLPADVVRRVFAEIRGSSGPEEEPDALTQREREILASFSQGESYAAIAESRDVKPVTIRNAMYVIQNKLGLGTKQEVVVWAVRNGILDS